MRFDDLIRDLELIARRIEKKYGDMMHSHKCKNCNNCWSHPDSTALCNDKEVFTKAHTCSNCGREEYWKAEENCSIQQRNGE